jgi:hypothetical protein
MRSETPRAWGRRLLPAGLVLAALAAAGCGKSGTVEGTVYWRDKPVTGGTVVFIPQEEGKRSVTATIGSDGKFKAEKVPKGSFKVAIDTSTARPSMPGAAGKWRPPKDAPVTPQMEKMYGGQGNPKDAWYIPDPDAEKFKNADTSGKTIEVTGDSQDFDIKLP